VEDPSTDDSLCEVADAQPDDAITALEAASEAQVNWAKHPPRERGEILPRAFETITERIDELLGDPNNPSGVRYHSNGKPSAKTPNGSKVILSGKGGWNPKKDTAKGGGHYTIKDSSGALKAQGSWRVTDFRSFEQFRGGLALLTSFDEAGSVRLNRASSEPVEVVSQPKQ
jgi:hypothetical protein